MSCAFCDRVGVLATVAGASVCAACARMIGTLAEGPNGAPYAWNEAPSSSSNASTTAAVPVDVDADLERFKDGVARQIAPEDSSSHLALATAYVEMGLLVDARREAGIAARHGTPELVGDALRILLTPPLLRDDGIARLRAHLLGTRSN